MCQLCHVTLNRLLTKGIVSKETIEACQKEILTELEQFETNALEKLSTSELEILKRSVTGSALEN